MRLHHLRGSCAARRFGVAEYEWPPGGDPAACTRGHYCLSNGGTACKMAKGGTSALSGLSNLVSSFSYLYGAG
jgi:hypothetical protein